MGGQLDEHGSFGRMITYCDVCRGRKRLPKPCWVCKRFGWLRDFLLVCNTQQERDNLEELCAVALHKPGSNGSKGGSAMPLPTSASFLTSYADLTAFLCSDVWPDGSKRQPGTLLVSAGQGRWNLKVKDPNGKRYAFYSDSTLQDALAGLDLGLSTDDLDWRAEKDWSGRK
jgi:hypothetical protein